MKKLLAVSAISAVSVLAPAGAAFAASISNTGPDSVNIIQGNTSTTFDVSCSNNTDVLSVNGQTAASGQATVSGSTTVQGAQSGDALNSNDVTLNENVSCAPAKAASTTTTSPSTPGKGGAVQAQNTSSLPNTGSNPLALAAIAAGVLGALAVVSRLGAKAYSYFRA